MVRMMTTATETKLLTAPDLLALPRGRGIRYELIRGVLVEKMGTGDPHAITVTRISFFITIYTEETGYGDGRSGEPGYLLELGPDTVRCPDVSWIDPARVPPGGFQGYPNLAPDLAVEVKSPRNSHREMTAKARMWLSYGSQLVWVADPETATLTIHRENAPPETLSEDDELTGGELLPGFSVPVWRLFRRER